MNYGQSVDLAYLRAHPDLLPMLVLHQRIRETPVAGGSICQAQRLTTDDGESIFVKTLPGAPPGFFAAEAAGLRWLADAGGPVPGLVAAFDEVLVLDWVEPGSATPDTAHRLGGELARLHRAGAEAFGAAWSGYLGRLPMDNTPSPGPWPTWFVERRLEPYLRMSFDQGALTRAEVREVTWVLSHAERLAGPAAAEPAARIHGDLWPGNVVWGHDRAWLIDPAAHGGHRETDLATLAMFGGAPLLDQILEAYQDVWPLAAGWRDRIPLHQLHLWLAHTAMFGSGYQSEVLAAVRALRAAC